jgi:hypothetical protein
MSLDYMRMVLGSTAPERFVGPPVSVPMAVSYLHSPCTWELRRGRLYHGKKDDTDDIREVAMWLDPWEVRDRFLRLQTAHDIAPFLSDTGEFQKRLGSGQFTTEDLFEIQGIVRYLLTTAPSKWRIQRPAFRTERIAKLMLWEYRQFKFRFSWSSRSHAVVVETASTLDAILASVFVDHMRQAQFGFCARPDCRRQFELKSRHKRKYCSPDCGHVMAVRESRNRSVAKKTAARDGKRRGR